MIIKRDIYDPTALGKPEWDPPGYEVTPTHPNASVGSYATLRKEGKDIKFSSRMGYGCWGDVDGTFWPKPTLRGKILRLLRGIDSRAWVLS